MYSALDKGVVDGTDWGTPAMNLALGFNQVCDYFVYPEYRSAPMSEFSVQTKIWEKLPDDLKAIIETGVRDMEFQEPPDPGPAGQRGRAEMGSRRRQGHFLGSG